MEIRHQYYYFKSALTSEQCNRIIETGKQYIENYKKNNIPIEAVTRGNREKGSNPDAKPIDDKTLSETKNEKVYIRDSKCAFLDERWIYDLVLPVIVRANTNAGWKYEFDYIEPIQFTKYGVKQYYNWHCDQTGCHNSVNKTDDLNLNNKVRKLSVSINLSDPNDYDGGDLMLKQNGSNKNLTINEIKPQGSIVVFPSYVWHKVTPVTKGTRYSLVLWTSGQPFK